MRKNGFILLEFLIAIPIFFLLTFIALQLLLYSVFLSQVQHYSYLSAEEIVYNHLYESEEAKENVLKQQIEKYLLLTNVFSSYENVDPIVSFSSKENCAELLTLHENVICGFHDLEDESIIVNHKVLYNPPFNSFEFKQLSLKGAAKKSLYLNEKDNSISIFGFLFLGLLFIFGALFYFRKKLPSCFKSLFKKNENKKEIFVILKNDNDLHARIKRFFPNDFQNAYFYMADNFDSLSINHKRIFQSIQNELFNLNDDISKSDFEDISYNYKSFKERLDLIYKKLIQLQHSVNHSEFEKVINSINKKYPDDTYLK